MGSGIQKAAGYTQTELAKEVGVSRRMIAYSERETSHPPAAMLKDLADVLAISMDEFLGREAATPAPKLTRSLLRRFQKIEKMGPKEKHQVLQVLDTFIEREELREQASA